MIIPAKQQCLKILKENNVPDNIIAHLNAVHDFSIQLCDVLEKRGIHVNRNLVAAGALLHDIKKTSQNDHVIEGYEFIKSLGFPEVALLVRKHSIVHLQDEEFIPETWEEKIVFYADKRVQGDKVVSIEERFEYARKRYKKPDIEEEFELTKKIEKEVLGDNKLQ